MEKDIVLAGIILTALLTGCTGNDSSARFTSSSITVEEVIENSIAETAATTEVSTEASAATEISAEESFDNADGASGTAAESIEGVTDTEEETDIEGLLSSTEGIDVDLTLLSSTMVYSTVYDIVYFPENYLGKTVKMQGIYTHYHDDTTDKDYFACFIQDAAACCSQGIEFELSDDYVYPDDYPEEGDIVTVSGVFDLYEEDGFTYCTLRNSVLYN